MTRKEIEKRCREAMQENIPDKESLWQKIESNLPEQQETVFRKSHLSMITVRRIMTAAACLLFLVGGLQLRNSRDAVKLDNMDHSSAEDADNIPADDDDAGCDAAADYESVAPALQENNSQNKNILRYQDLNLSGQQGIHDTADLSRLGVQDAYFNESAILAKTELFLDVQVLNGYQNQETGEMQYILKILDVYGGTLDVSELVIVSRSAYILEKEHEYILPVYQDQQNHSNWNLSYECAPQIEKTLDHKIILHNGWQCVMHSDLDQESVLYDSYGKDDYFYDRMYLTGDMAVEILIQEWEKNL